MDWTPSNLPERPVLKTRPNRVLRFFKFFGGGIYTPDASTYEPIEILLNAETKEERDNLTDQWKENRLNELNFVGVVSALLCGVLTSTGSWPTILPNGMESPWPVRTSWYCGIVLALFSILAAADQTIRLHRLAAHRDALANIRSLLSKQVIKARRPNKSGRVKPSKIQVYTWQLPVIFLTTATICMIVGMFLHVWSATRRVAHEAWWNENSKTAVTFTSVAFVSIVLFFLGQLSLHSPDNDFE